MFFPPLLGAEDSLRQIQLPVRKLTLRQVGAGDGFLGGGAAVLQEGVVRQDPLVLIYFLTISRHSDYRPFSGLGLVFSGCGSVRFSAELIC